MSAFKPGSTALAPMNIPCFASAVPVIYHNHPGYGAYLDQIERSVPLYNTSKPNKKWHVIRNLITELLGEEREFLFLNRDGSWSEYSDTHVHSRTTNLMRQFVRHVGEGVPIGEKDVPVFNSSIPATLHNHPGYIAYLNLVQSYGQTYTTAKPNHKVLVLRNVIEKMSERDMRFVKLDAGGAWIEYDEKETVILEKIRTLIKMFSKHSAEGMDHMNISILNDCTVDEEDLSLKEEKSSYFTPSASSRKIKIPNIISHTNSNDDEDTDTSSSSSTATENSNENEDDTKRSMQEMPKPIGIIKKRNITQSLKRLPSMKKARKNEVDGGESPPHDSSHSEDEESSPFPQFNSSLRQIIQIEVQRQLKRSSQIKIMESKIKKLEQEAILHNQQKGKMDEKIEELQLQVDKFQQEIGFQD